MGVPVPSSYSSPCASLASSAGGSSSSCPETVVLVSRNRRHRQQPCGGKSSSSCCESPPPSCSRSLSPLRFAPPSATTTAAFGVYSSGTTFLGSASWASLSSASSTVSCSSSSSSPYPSPRHHHHHRSKPRRPRAARQSLAFALVAGVIAGWQLAYHAVYLWHRESGNEIFFNEGGFRNHGGSGGIVGGGWAPEEQLTRREANTEYWKDDAAAQSVPSSLGKEDRARTEHLPDWSKRRRTTTSTSATTTTASGGATAGAATAVHPSAPGSEPLPPQNQQQPLAAKPLRGDESALGVGALAAAAAAAAAPPKDSSPPPQPRYEVLLVVPGLGEAHRIDTVARSISALTSQSRTTANNANATAQTAVVSDCWVYVWNASLVDEARTRLGPLGCHVEESQGMWTHHMSRVPDLQNNTNVTHVAILLDDVDATDVNLDDFLELMEWSKFGVATPAFDDPIYPAMRVRYDCFFHRTDFVNVFFTVFTAEVWQCWQSQLLDPTDNPLGWGMDAALHHLCDTSLGVIDVYQGRHLGGTTSSYSQAAARQQMSSYLAQRLLTRRQQKEPPTPLEDASLPSSSLESSSSSSSAWPVFYSSPSGLSDASDAAFAPRYLECAGHDRPAAFPRCQLYWDGTTPPPDQFDVPWNCGGRQMKTK